MYKKKNRGIVESFIIGFLLATPTFFRKSTTDSVHSLQYSIRPTSIKKSSSYWQLTYNIIVRVAMMKIRADVAEWSSLSRRTQ
jgi:hypothetical protein